MLKLFTSYCACAIVPSHCCDYSHLNLGHFKAVKDSYYPSTFSFYNNALSRFQDSWRVSPPARIREYSIGIIYSYTRAIYTILLSLKLKKNIKDIGIIEFIYQDSYIKNYPKPSLIKSIITHNILNLYNKSFLLYISKPSLILVCPLNKGAKNV